MLHDSLVSLENECFTKIIDIVSLQDLVTMFIHQVNEKLVDVKTLTNLASIMCSMLGSIFFDIVPYSQCFTEVVELNSYIDP